METLIKTGITLCYEIHSFYWNGIEWFYYVPVECFWI
ncbi:hypothetical protein LCGC14_1743560 [marine sediment metagenome]|uniref:Uncharacterized protein n=1 Tax=marine sediment metagenome TaxID=412755 RepID=A0A0F9H5X4_9ZZZZ